MTTANPFSLEAKRVLVTGASSGIGRQIAILFSRMGADIVLTARNQAHLAETLASMAPGNHIVLPADLTEPDQRRGLADATGEVNGVVHSAGTSLLSPVRLLPERHVRDLFAVNYDGPVFLTQALLKNKAVRGGGSILFVASIAAHIGVAGVGVYSGTKAALVATARCMAVELARARVRVNCLSPGLVASPLLDMVAQNVSLEEKARDYPLGLGTVEDVANAAAYFISDASRWVTGTTLVMDGGLTIG